jgi:hypothetical protein
MNGFQIRQTLVKFLKAFLPAELATLLGIWGTLPAGTRWWVYLVTQLPALASGTWVTVEDVRKHTGNPAPLFTWGQVGGWILRKVLPAGTSAVLMIAAMGCVTTRFENVWTDREGVPHEIRYSCTSSAWPFAKLDSGVHDMGMSVGGSTIKIGQTAQGMDNTGMAAMIDLVKMLAERATAAAVVAP